MSKARRAILSTTYKGKNVSAKIRKYMTSFSYDDVASGESDSISVTLRDDEGKWRGAWYPQKGDRIKPAITFVNWTKNNTKRKLKCGSFQVDNISFSGAPDTLTLSAASIPQDNAFNNEERDKTWESVTVEAIAGEIASRAGIALYYDAGSIGVKSIEQSKQTDCKFLYSLCQSYGLAVKVYSGKIVIYDEEAYERKPPVLTLKKKDLLSFDYNTTLAGTYTGAKVAFTDPNDEKDYSVDIGGGDRILKVNVTADNIGDAELKGKAKLRSENKKETTMTVSIMANPAIVSGINIKIEGLAKLSGKYFVERVRTKLTGGGASQATLTLRKIDEKKEAEQKGKMENQSEPYEVKSGDTLWALAKQYLGSSVRYTEIYEANKDVIEQEAKNHGKSSSENGYWIYPGTILNIPKS